MSEGLRSSRQPAPIEIPAPEPGSRSISADPSGGFRANQRTVLPPPPRTELPRRDLPYSPAVETEGGAARPEVDRWKAQLDSRLEGLQRKSDEVEELRAEVERLSRQLEELAQRLETTGRDIPTEDVVTGFSLEPDPRETRLLDFGLDDLLQVMIKHKASDLHLKPDAPPTVRLNGDLIPVGDHILSEAQCRSLVFAAIPMIKRKLLIRRREVDHAYVSAGVRFRLNAFLERGRVSAAFRMVNSVIPAFRELNLPPILEKLAMMNNGLVLVTGPAGSGKSTTLASVIDFINRNRKVHVVTIEDPIEFHHRDQNSFVTQREVGSDTQSFPEALRQALRQDPNVIMLGEMRDAETIMTAVTAAETGHLVLSTLHTPNAVQAIDRIVDAFQGESQQQVRLLLSTCLRAVISQKLLNRIDGRGRVPATEVMVCTATIASHILDGETHNIYQYVASGASEGMQTYTQSLARLVQRGLISKEEAMYHADRPTEFRLQAEGHTSSTVPSDSESSGSYVSYL